MSRIEPIPLAGDEDAAKESESAGLGPVQAEAPAAPPCLPAAGRFERGLASLVIATICLLHLTAIWWSLGGREGLNNGWPLWRDDHPLYYHSALVTRAFLKQTGTTAGYDPAFMAGYAKSVIFPASSTLPELVVAAFGGGHPERAYKLYVLIGAGVVPLLMVGACLAWRIRPAGIATALLLQMLYIWTDFPINYVGFGMVPYFLGVPLALLAGGMFVRYLETGGFISWTASASLMIASVLVHLTTAMILIPAAAAAYFASAFPKARQVSPPLPAHPRRAGTERSSGGTASASRLSWGQHFGVWLIPIAVLAANAFWWLPGISLASTKGASDFAFRHIEDGVIQRLGQIAYQEAPIEVVLLAIGVPGLAILFARGKARGWGLLVFALAGFFWGYLAAFWRTFDFLQPGRHTYAFFSAIALAGGLGWEELRLRLRMGQVILGGGRAVVRLDRWIVPGLILITLRMVGAPLVYQIRTNVLAPDPFLSSRPPSRLRWIVDTVKSHVKPGERLLYEESGKDLPGLADPYQRGRFSGLLPERTGVEVLGGPYLYASLATNFTQFGEGKLFGKENWSRDDFVRYARLYRPSAILCWTPHARAFCKSNPDLIKIVEDEGVLLFGRVLGYEGDAVEGQARVVAEPGRLLVSDMKPGVDGTILLRYHSVPCLRTSPPIPCIPERQEDDPVPLIRLQPPAGTRDVTIELRTHSLGL